MLWLHPRRWANSPTLEPPKMASNNKEYYKNLWWYKGTKHPSIGKRNFVYNKEDLIGIATKFFTENGEPPRREDFEIGGYPSPTTITRHFGSWNKFIEAAGYTPRPKRGTPYSRQEKIKDPYLANAWR